MCDKNQIHLFKGRYIHFLEIQLEVRLLRSPKELRPSTTCWNFVKS